MSRWNLVECHRGHGGRCYKNKTVCAGGSLRTCAETRHVWSQELSCDKYCHSPVTKSFFYFYFFITRLWNGHLRNWSVLHFHDGLHVLAPVVSPEKNLTYSFIMQKACSNRFYDSNPKYNLKKSKIQKSSTTDHFLEPNDPLLFKKSDWSQNKQGQKENRSKNVLTVVKVDNSRVPRDTWVKVGHEGSDVLCGC